MLMCVQEVEATKVSVRSIRKQGMVAVKQLASEDEKFSAEREVWKPSHFTHPHFPSNASMALLTFCGVYWPV